MRPTRNTLPEGIRGGSVLLLGTGLVHAIDLERHAKQAHWNVRGMHFLSLHKLFDAVHEAAGEWGDLMAERLVALGGVADGRVKTVAARTTLGDFDIKTGDETELLQALAASMARFGELARESIDTATDAGDAATADVFTEVSRGLDQHLWMVESHLPA